MVPPGQQRLCNVPRRVYPNSSHWSIGCSARTATWPAWLAHCSSASSLPRTASVPWKRLNRLTLHQTLEEAILMGLSWKRLRSQPTRNEGGGVSGEREFLEETMMTSEEF